MRLSARNQLKGTVTAIKEGVVTAEIVVRLPGGEEIVSVITIESVRNLGIGLGSEVTAIVKSTDVMIAVNG